MMLAWGVVGWDDGEDVCWSINSSIVSGVKVSSSFIVLFLRMFPGNLSQGIERTRECDANCPIAFLEKATNFTATKTIGETKPQDCLIVFGKLAQSLS